MLKYIIISASILAVAFGRPQAPGAAASASTSEGHTPSGNASVSFLKNDRQPLDDKGTYKYDIELSDGTKLIQEGNTEAPGAGDNETSLVIKGSYSYIAPDGTPISISYIANKDGFQPTGDSIPKAGGNATAAASPKASSAAAPATSATSAAAAPTSPAAAPASPAAQPATV